MTISDRPDDGPLVTALRQRAATYTWDSAIFYASDAELMRNAADRLASTPANTAQVAPDGLDWAALGHEYAENALSGGWPKVVSPQYALSGAFTAMAKEIERLRSASPAQVASAPDRAGVALARVSEGHRFSCPSLEGGNDACNCGFDAAATILAALSATPSREGEVS